MEFLTALRSESRAGVTSRARSGPFLAAALLGVLALSGAPARAQDPEPGVSGDAECCIALLTPVGARSSAMAGSITALGGADAVFRNPAGLAALRGGRFMIHHSDDMTLDVQVDAFSLLFQAFSGTFGLSYQLFDRGEIGTTDPTGQPTGQLSYRDHLLVGSFALDLGGGLSAGLNYKVYQERVGCSGLCAGEESSATTQATDLGVRWRPAWHPALHLGVSVVNAGFPLQVINAEQSDLFPSRLHVGVAYDILGAAPADSLVGLRVAVDARDRLADPGSPRYSVGAELDFQEAIFLRAGYASGRGIGAGAAVGLEVRYDRFEVGVSRSFVNTLLEGEEPFQVTLGVVF